MGRLKRSVAGTVLCAGVVSGCMTLAFPVCAADAASALMQDMGTQKVSVQAKDMGTQKVSIQAKKMNKNK